MKKFKSAYQTPNYGLTEKANIEGGKDMKVKEIMSCTLCVGFYDGIFRCYEVRHHLHFMSK